MYEVYLDGECLYYPNDKEYAIYNSILKDTLSCASEFTFQIPCTNPKYVDLYERQSMVQILRDSKEIFYGEIREVTENIGKTKLVYCVSELAFLFDSVQPQARYQNITPEQFFIELINIHNSKVEEKKRFTVGMVTVKDPNNSLYRYTNYEDTLTAIRSKLCEPLGGYLRIRKVNGVRYIDLIALEEYGVYATQPIQFGVNLLNYTSKKSASELATVCVPLGAKLEEQVVDGLDAYTIIEEVNNGKNYVINEEAYKNFGWVEKVVNWNDVTVPSNLFKKATEWVNNNQYKILALELKAVDLAELEVNMKPYFVGDMVRAIAEPFGMDMYFPLMEKVTYINEPANNDIVLSYQKKVSYTTQQNNVVQEVEKAIPQTSDLLLRAKQNASEIIKFASEGNVHTVYNEQGRPIEVCIMDTDDINTAQRIWRWNMNGFGYSNTGYNGDFGTAMTMDGAIVADFITVGILNAALIKAGILSDEAGLNFWDMVTGEFKMSSSAKVGESTVASVKDVEDGKNSAVELAGEATDRKLVNYSTIKEMNSAIERNAESMTSTFNKSIETVMEYANDVAQEAQDNANENTNELLEQYSTTEQMNSAIKQTAEGVTSEANKKIEETKVYAEQKAINAENNAKANTVEVLKSYSTSEEMNALISQSAEAVKSEVSKSYATQESVKVMTDNLQQQIDGAIETFTGNEVPTLSNVPANSWINDYEKQVHLGDLYIVNSYGGNYAGFYYRFEENNGTYEWVLLKDNEITKALQDAREANQKAQEVANNLASNYSTTAKMNSAIEQKADSILQNVNTEIQETKQYADGVAEEAEENANANTTQLLKSYSTTAQMNAAINLKANEIGLSVDEKIQETKVYADSSATNAKNEANANTTEKLKLYSTKEEMNAAINLKADSITQEVNKQTNETKVYADDSANKAKEDAIANTTEQLKSYTKTTDMNTLIAQSASDVKIEVNQTISNLQQQIDGAIETYSGNYVPLITNAPASGWSTEEKATHIGDLFIVNSDGGDYAGFYYRFEYSGSVYKWTLLKDNEVAKALQDAKEANERAEEIAKDLEDNYSTTEQMNAAINVSAEGIRTEVRKKIGSDEVVSAINQSAEEIELKGNRIIIQSDKWTVGKDGTMTIIDAKIYQIANNVELLIENAEIQGGYVGEGTNFIDFSNRVTDNGVPIAGMAIGGENLVQLRTPRLYIGTDAVPDYVYQAQTTSFVVQEVVSTSSGNVTYNRTLKFKNGILVN